MSLNKVFLDLDDTLADLVNSWNAWLYENEFTEEKLTKKDITTYDFYIKNFNSSAMDFYKKYNCYEEWVQPLVGSHLFLDWCEQNFDEVEILSYATTEKCKSDKKEFVKKHFGFDNIKFSDSKNEKYTFTKNSILVDDYPANILPHILNNKCPGIIFNHNNENSWSCLSGYREMTNKFTMDDMKNVWISNDYKSLQDILERLKYEKIGCICWKIRSREKLLRYETN